MKKIKRGKRLNYNAAIEIRYTEELQFLVRQMITTTSTELKGIFCIKSAKYPVKYAQDATFTSEVRKLLAALTFKFQTLFNSYSRPIAKAMVKDTDRYATTTVRESLKELTGVTLKTDVTSKVGKERAQALVAENIALIRSIPQQYHTQILGAVMRSITKGVGGSLGELETEIQKYGNMTLRRAKMIALDQTRKAYQTISRTKMEDRGVKKFEWQHSGGGQEPRPSHIRMSGNIYSFDDPPQINLDNPKEPPVHGFPGDAPNCRCTMRPIAEWE